MKFLKHSVRHIASSIRFKRPEALRMVNLEWGRLDSRGKKRENREPHRLGYTSYPGH